MKLPNELYVRVENEGDGADEFLTALADPEGFAVVGETVKATLYHKVGTVEIKAPLQVTPKYVERT